MTDTPPRPSGARFTEFLACVFCFALAALSAAIRLMGSRKGWSTGYGDTAIQTVSTVFWAVAVLELVSGVFLLVRRRLGWSWVAVAASVIPSPPGARP